MPRVPEASGSSVPAVLDPGLTPREALGLGETALRPLGVLISQQEQLARRRKLVDATTLLQRAINDSQLATEQEDPDAMLSAHDERVDAALDRIRNDVLGGNPDLIAEFDVRTQPSVEARRIGIAQRQRSRQVDALRESAQDSLREAERSVTLDPEGQSAQLQYESALDAIRSLPLPESVRNEMIERSQRRVDLFAAQELAQESPGEFLALTDTLEELDTQFPNLELLEIQRLRARAEAEQDRLIRQREADAEALQKEIQEDTFKQAILDLGRGDMTIEKLEAMSQDMSAAQTATIQSRLGQATTGRTDPEELIRLRQLIDRDPEEAVEAIDEALRTGLIADQGTYDRYRTMALKAADKPGGVDGQAHRRIEQALRPHDEMLGVDRAQAVIRADRAREEYDAFVEANPGATTSERVQKRREIIQAYAPSFAVSTAALRVPFGFSGTRLDVLQNPEAVLAESQRKLSEARSRLSEDEILRHIQNLRAWRQALEQQAIVDVEAR